MFSYFQTIGQDWYHLVLQYIQHYKSYDETATSDTVILSSNRPWSPRSFVRLPAETRGEHAAAGLSVMRPAPRGCVSLTEGDQTLS
jgi:hypothetical protein